jgi:helicase
MQISDLPFPDMAKDAIRKEIKEFNPVQQAALPYVLKGQNVVVASPTASGKTLVAEIAVLRNFLAGGKCIYVVPLKALASEKYREFKEKYPFLRTAISIGDLDSAEQWLGSYDVIIASNEKLDSLLRHNVPWIKDVSLLVVDEIHMLNDATRGPALEVVITRLQNVKQIIALSATIQNADEIAKWLKAKLVKSDYRPVKLQKGVSFPDGDSLKIKMLDEDFQLPLDDHALAHDTVKKNKQCLIFVSTRKSAEATAEKINLFPFLSSEEKTVLAKLSKDVEKALPVPTKQCKRLALCVRQGTAFHHAGLLAKQRDIIESAFREGKLKIISSTPTLCLDENVQIWNSMSLKKPNEKITNVIALKKDSLDLTSVAGVHSMEAPKTMAKIETVNGNSITLTKNHKILIRKGAKTLLKPAGSVKKGEHVATAGKINVDKCSKPKWSDFVKDNKLPFKNKKLDEHDFYFIGAMLGDGYSGAEITESGIKYKGSPCIVGRDQDVFELVEEFCSKYAIHFKKSKNSYGVPQIVMSKAKWFREFMIRCGIDKGAKKHISIKLLEANERLLGNLLSGLYDTDGCMQKNGVVSFSSISPRLIDDTRRALLRYRIVTWKREKQPNAIKMNGKSYNTQKSIEISIQYNESLFAFEENIGFKVKRKCINLKKIIDQRKNRPAYLECKNCKYIIHPGALSGRTRQQKDWEHQKKKSIEFLALNGPMSSNEIYKKLGFVPWKGENRLNLHFPFINRKRVGNKKIWTLNNLGRWCYLEIIKKNKSLEEYFTENAACPLCSNAILKIPRGTWKKTAFQGDIFWDEVKKIENVKPTSNFVYDVILPNDDKTDHMFVANGFIVHNSYGINLPAYRVLIRDTKRFDSRYGSNYIPVMDVHQMMGRAGRPKYDKEGQAILLAKSKEEADDLKERYILGEAEPIYSKLGMESVLRMHVLALIASEAVKSKHELRQFFSRTFFAHQYDIDSAMEKVDNVLQLLESYKFIRIGEEQLYEGFKTAFDLAGNSGLTATKIGKRVSELYVDPASAFAITQNMRPLTELEALMVINSCPELYPMLTARKKELEELEDLLEKSGLEAPDVWSYDYEEFMDEFKTALMFMDWTDEKGEDALLEKFSIAPGELYNKLLSAEWMLYTAAELAILLNKREEANIFNKLRLRIKHGVREELLKLIKLKGIGRVRARKLYNAGIKNYTDVKSSIPKVEEILGKKIAQNLLTQGEELEEKVRASKRRR